MSKKAKVILGVIAVLAIAIVAWRLFVQFSNPPVAAETGYTAVNAATASLAGMEVSVQLSGKAQADNSVTVIPTTPGIVRNVAVKIGDRVAADQVLISLDKSLVQASYDQAQAGYMAAEANFTATMEKIENAKLQLERSRELFAAGALSRSDLEQIEIAASDSSVLALEAQLAQARAGLSAAEKTMNDMDLRSPIAGVVTALSVSEGNMASGPAAVVTALDRIYVQAAISEKFVNVVHNGQKVAVEVPAAASETFEGLVEDLSLAADAMTGQFSLKVYLDNREQLIKPGMFAKMEITTLTKENIVVIPLDAVVFRGGRDVVYTVADGAAVETPVTTGLEDGDRVEIVSGLSVGDIFVTRGVGFINDGTEVKIIELDGAPFAPAADSAALAPAADGAADSDADGAADSDPEGGRA
ncbi:MAG: efflux RND transporter periplasmic adaptor subunit [Gracilibacteraceae bacterium]|jgi:RND family efflux transporter MFP subunit|nr:efflux RND transporter periplasmic adaptor subunit [Gracilibacteraceae bacterium]